MDVPEIHVGVDEAGKGPVFGSMFAAAIALDDRSRLPDEVRDSKRLSPARRETIAESLRTADRIRIGIADVSVDQIDRPDTDMNSLTVSAHADAIQAAVDGESDNKISCLCDACDTDTNRFARRVADACSLDIRSVEARHGADDDDLLVGAASILAKVERDTHIAELANRYGPIGSGYPSDPTTRTFLEDYVADTGELPPFARRSWSTCADVLADANQTGLDAYR